MAPAERVANQEQAALLLDPRLADLFGKLGRAPHSASGLARALGKPLSTVHGQLQRLVEAGVVEQVGCTQRAGRPMREYAALFPWLVPFAVTPAATLRELLQGSFDIQLRQQLDALAHFMTGRAAEWTIRLEAVEGDLAHAIYSDDASHPRFKSPILGNGAALHLKPERAQELSDRLLALLNEYVSSADEEGEPWSLTLLLTPGENRR